MKFGNYECVSIDLGNLLVDGGAMFGVVPKVLWEKKIPADDKNRIHMKANSLLIQGNGKHILVDTGCGNKLSEKEKKIYDIDNDINIDALLSKHGLNCEDITDVILTHLHFDHTGGATGYKNGAVCPTFPSAVYYLQKKQWEAANYPNLRDGSSFIKDNYMPLLDSGVLKIIDGHMNLFEGIDIVVTHGHTPGQQHPLIRGEGTSLFYCADIFPTSAHLPVVWHMAYDVDPLLVMKEKQDILKRALKENWVLFFEHDPDIIAARIKQDPKKGIVIKDSFML